MNNSTLHSWYGKNPYVTVAEGLGQAVYGPNYKNISRMDNCNRMYISTIPTGSSYVDHVCKRFDTYNGKKQCYIDVLTNDGKGCC